MRIFILECTGYYISQSQKFINACGFFKLVFEKRKSSSTPPAGSEKLLYQTLEYCASSNITPAHQHSQSSPILQIMAELDVLVSWQILKGSQGFLHTFSMALYHKWDVKNGFAYVLQFFSLISERLGCVKTEKVENAVR